MGLVLRKALLVTERIREGMQQRAICNSQSTGSQTGLNINFLELLMVYLALKSFSLHTRCHVLIRTDNTATWHTNFSYGLYHALSQYAYHIFLKL